jgi:hypothetical protein
MTTAYPLTWPEGWPRRPGYTRKRAQFKSQKSGGGTVQISVSEGMRRVLVELQALRTSRDDVVVSTNLRLRLDGFPRSDQPEPSDPGAAVYWQQGQTMKVMAIDRYDRVADNLAAIAATLEAMRAIERHGGGEILDRAFTGFTALPAPKKWWDILGILPTATADQINARFRALAAIHHPDRDGGDHGRMAEISAARDEALKTARAA